MPRRLCNPEQHLHQCRRMQAEIQRLRQDAAAAQLSIPGSHAVVAAHAQHSRSQPSSLTALDGTAPTPAPADSGAGSPDTASLQQALQAAEAERDKVKRQLQRCASGAGGIILADGQGLCPALGQPHLQLKGSRLALQLPCSLGFCQTAAAAYWHHVLPVGP